MEKDNIGIFGSLIRSAVNPHNPDFTLLTQTGKHRLVVITALICSVAATINPQHAQAQQLVVDVNVFGFNINQENANQQLTGACTVLADDTSEAAMDLLNTCQLIDDLDQNNPDDVVRLQEILNTFSPEEAFSVNDSIVYVSDYQTTNVHSRINSLRSPPSNTVNTVSAQPYRQSGASSALTFLDKNSATEQRATGGGAAAVGPLSRVGIFFSGQFSSGEVDGSTYEQDADISSNSFTAVTDYRFTDSIVAGIGFGVLQNETTFSNVDGGTDSEGFNLTAFGSWYREANGYIDVVLDFGTNSHDLERGIGNDPGAPVLAQSSTDSSAFSFSIGAGKYFSVSNWDLGGYLRLSLTDGTIDGYTETASNDNDGSGSVFSLDSQKVKSTTMVIGVEASRVISTSKAVLIPVIRIEYESENEDKKDDLTATLVASQISASYRGTERDTAYTNLGLGGSAVFKNGKSAYAFYETHLQHDFVTQDWIKFGLRLEFQ